jgi:hypothetical protein
MKLNKNSINAKLYRWFYQKDQMPKSLCPYFWKLVIAWVFALPLAIVTLPAIIMGINGSMNFRHDGAKEDQFTRIFASLVMYGMIFVAFSMLFSISLFWHSFPNKSFLHDAQISGIICWGVVIIVGLSYAIEHFYKKIKQKDKGVDVNPSLIKELIKAKYNKYCPKIDWK